MNPAINGENGSARIISGTQGCAYFPHLFVYLYGVLSIVLLFSFPKMLSLYPAFLVVLLLPSALGNRFVQQGHHNERKTCTVRAYGDRTDDVPNILHAFSECGQGGTIVFPSDQNYWIAQRLNPIVNDVEIEWWGLWTVSAISTIPFSNSSLLKSIVLQQPHLLAQ